MTEDAFTVDAQTKFKDALAQAAGVSNSAVSIDQVEGRRTGHRRLLKDSIRVDTRVKAAYKCTADTMGAKLTADNINGELAMLGLPPATMLEVAKSTLASTVTAPSDKKSPNTNEQTNPPSLLLWLARLIPSLLKVGWV